MTTPAEHPLQGLGILVTRAAHQAGPLAGLIAAAGGEAILYPTLEILEPHDLAPALALIEGLEAFDYAIFVSPNAVAKGMALIGARRGLPPQLGIAAVGQGSAAALREAGVAAVLVPESNFDSEGLLDLPQFQEMHGKRVAIFRGEGGRELLGDSLAARGARVEYAACYRRARPGIDPAPLLARWARGEVHAVTVSSGENLRNLFDMLGEAGRPSLRETPLFAVHQRIAELARSLGVRRATVTGAGDEGLMAGLTAWQSQVRA